MVGASCESFSWPSNSHGELSVPGPSKDHSGQASVPVIIDLTEDDTSQSQLPPSGVIELPPTPTPTPAPETPKPTGEVSTLDQVPTTVYSPSHPEAETADQPQPIDDDDDLDMELFGPDGLDFEEEGGVSVGDGGPESLLRETELAGVGVDNDNGTGETPTTPPVDIIDWDTWEREWVPHAPQLSDLSKNVDHSPTQPLYSESDFDWPWPSPLLHPSEPMEGLSALIPPEQNSEQGGEILGA